MPVFREAPRIYSVSAPNLASVNAWFVALAAAGTPLGQNWRVARLGARSLSRVIDDLHMVLTHHWVAPAGIGLPPAGMPAAQWVTESADPKDLITLLKYFVYVWFPAARAARVVARGAAPPTPNDLLFDANVNYIENRLMATERWIHGFPGIAAMLAAGAYWGGAAGYWTVVNTWQNLPAGFIALGVIPSLGIVELLCRTLLRGCMNMAAFDARVNGGPAPVAGNPPIPGLTLRGLPAVVGLAAWANCRHGIAGTVFLCCGADNAASTKVLTSSQDNWGGYTQLSNWARRVRQTQRRNVPPVRVLPVPPNLPRRDVPGLSMQVRGFFNAHTAGLPGGPALAAARNVVLTNWGNGQNHLGVALPVPVPPPPPFVWRSARGAEASRPMHCPAFTPKARCLRCQALFGYGVVAPVSGPGGLEATDMALLTTRAVTGWYCAETLADHCCRSLGAVH